MIYFLFRNFPGGADEGYQNCRDNVSSVRSSSLRPRKRILTLVEVMLYLMHRVRNEVIYNRDAGNDSLRSFIICTFQLMLLG
jgi:hypothetical protein